MLCLWCSAVALLLACQSYERCQGVASLVTRQLGQRCVVESQAAVVQAMAGVLTDVPPRARLPAGVHPQRLLLPKR